MKTRDCSHFRETLLRVQDDPQTAIPDELALHLDDCSTCRKLFDATKIDLDSDAFEVIPTAARKQIMDRLAAARRPRARWWVAAGVAAALVLVVAGSWLVVDHEPSRSHTALVAALVDDHIRYLDHPDRQAAADPETLTDYLEAYVDFPVELPAPPGATLAGARRCSLLDRRATLAFYDTASGPVSYFVLSDDGTGLNARPCTGDPELSCLTHAGYHVIHWRHVGLLHAVVGEEPMTLMSLARACGAHASMEEPS